MTALQIQDLLHEGKAKKVFKTDRPGVVAVQYKDDATAFNAQKKAQLAGKGLLNWEISARLFDALEGHGIASHYLGCLEPGWMVVQQVEIVPVEVVLRNRAAGSLCRQLPIAPETPLEPALLDQGDDEESHVTVVFDNHAPRKYELARTLAPCAGCITLAATCGCWPKAFASPRNSASSKTCW